MNNTEKQGVALLENVKDLHNFVGYYATEGKNVQWTVICRRRSNHDKLVVDECHRSGIFYRVVICNRDFSELPIWQQGLSFFTMLFAFLTGNRKRWCKKLVNEVVNGNKFDVAVIGNGVIGSGIVGGAFFNLGDENHIIALQDGVGDYVPMKKFSIQNVHGFDGFKNYVISLMGYGGHGIRIPMVFDQYIELWAEYPEKVLYQGYQCIKKLFDPEKMDAALYNEIVTRTFQLDNLDLEGDIFLATLPIQDMEKGEYFKECTQNYINEHFPGKTVLLKRHPRDMASYIFSSDITLKEIPRDIPGELTLKKVNFETAIFMFTSSLCMDKQFQNRDLRILYAEQFENCTIGSDTYGERFWRNAHAEGISQDSIVYIP